MIDFDIALNNLISKYGLQSSYIEPTYVEKSIISEWDSIPDKENIAIWGAGEHTKELLQLLAPIEKNIVCIIDKNCFELDETLHDYPLIKPEELSNNLIDVIVVSSFAYREEIIKQIGAQHSSYKIIDLYENIKEVPVAFYLYREQVELYMLRKLYEKEFKTEYKRIYLWKLISRYLMHRDFIYAQRFIKEYIDNNFLYSRKLGYFLEELNTLLLSLKEILKARVYRDVTVFALDSLRFEDVIPNDTKQKSLMPHLYKLSKNSITFTNSFSTSTYTYGCMGPMFTNKLPFQELEYKKRRIDFDQSKLLTTLLEQGYEFYYLGIVDFFPQDLRVRKVFFHESSSHKEEHISRLKKNFAKNLPISRMLWSYFCELVKLEKPVFAFIHTDCIHLPYISNYHEELYMPWNPVFYVKNRKELQSELFTMDNQYKESLSYLDNQLDFYMGFLSNATITVTYGDHGQSLGENGIFGPLFGWHDSTIHVPLIISNRKLGSLTHTNLFSMVDFGKQILSLVQEGKLEVKETEFVIIQRDPIYNEKLLTNKDFIFNLGEKFIHGFQVVRGKHDKYVLYDHGIEEYYILPDENFNCINEKEYQQRINKMRHYAKKMPFPYLIEGKS
ncbi:sulfatase-like hydrolase/transferase [Aneurinibacillus migulanus]|uniref:Arylsulfatase A n=1 Tax=Aneurinibacillus migulanus TaxID=47500 RepID=A0A0D1UZB4_ANEMI|nr:sulfatase-like hydrolase/transferase [Aneurinibacillus migulanus]KIV52434.1 hypothetical protein TS65_23810 [Aneurinibacillus migulanus]KON94610.1 hypothetical protein AF333_02990 [Aneurinibacillus migulanus]MED0892658.1 sulfatase-like hydrolase/transferase [Aneurinibacillus migulanus]MED1614299.1 sulfatase-like hydrolase/transferase [Aneurinibacillus migulanus]SDI47900.1 Arylsulfatase A [Aneurinibacillus migulanus]